MKITVKAEKQATWVYEPSYTVEVNGNFSQTQILKIRSAVDKFVKSVEPVLRETPNDELRFPVDNKQDGGE